jgi:hypothetical protein
MRRIKDWRPAPGTVLGTIAIFISLGGVSYGVATGSIDSREIKNNTVGTKDIKNNSLRGKDIRTGTVLSGDVRNSTLTGTDVRNDSLTGNDVLESSLGKVPSATTADTAGAANLAGFSAATAGLLHTSPVTANEGDADKQVFDPANEHGFEVVLRCEAGNATILVKNVSAGAGAGADGDEASGEGAFSFDQGEEMPVNSSGADNIDEHGDFAAFGSKGSISGNIAVGHGTEVSATGSACAANGHGIG